MRPSNETSVLVLAIGASPAPDLLWIALRRGWAVRKPASATAAFQEAVRDRPRVVVVQVSRPEGEEIALIRLLCESPLAVLLVAVAVTQRDEIERAVRIAGVDCYIGGIANAALIEQNVVELLDREGCPAPANTRGATHRNDEVNRLSLAPLFSQQIWAAGDVRPPSIS